MSYYVRELRASDLNAINALERLTYGEVDLWKEQEIKSLIEKFPQGQFVVVDRASEKVIALSFSIIINSDKTSIFSTWQEIVENNFQNHTAGGDVLYGVEILVDATKRKRGLGKRLYTLRKRLMHKCGLQRMIIGARLSGYSHLHTTRPEEYLELILRHKIQNKNIDLQLKEGFQPLKIISDYLPEDIDCRGFAVIMQYKTPDLQGI